MKTRFAAALILIALLAASCGKSAQTAERADDDAVTGKVFSCSIAYVYDAASSGEEATDASTRKRVKAFAEEHGFSYSEYRSGEDTGEVRLEALTAAAESGADIVVAPGVYSYSSILTAQLKYPDTAFLSVGCPKPDLAYGELLESNTHGIRFNYADAGYVAGYFSVYCGARCPGFVSFADHEEAASAFAGMIDGAADAADELGVTLKKFVCSRSAWDEETGAYSADRTPRIVIDEGGDVLVSMGGETAACCRASHITAIPVLPVAYTPVEPDCRILPYPVFDYGEAAVRALERFCSNGGRWQVRDAGTVEVAGGAEDSLDAVFDGTEERGATQEIFNEIIEGFKSGRIRTEGAESFAEVPAGRCEIVYVN